MLEVSILNILRKGLIVIGLCPKADSSSYFGTGSYDRNRFQGKIGRVVQLRLQIEGVLILKNKK